MTDHLISICHILLSVCLLLPTYTRAANQRGYPSLVFGSSGFNLGICVLTSFNQFFLTHYIYSHHLIAVCQFKMCLSDLI